MVQELQELASSVQRFIVNAQRMAQAALDAGATVRNGVRRVRAACGFYH
jgi:hypothetical protein